MCFVLPYRVNAVDAASLQLTAVFTAQFAKTAKLTSTGQLKSCKCSSIGLITRLHAKKHALLHNENSSDM